MNETFESQINAFISAGNEVIGRPIKVSGNFTLSFGKGLGSKLVFGEGCVLSHMAINFEQGNALLSFGNASHVRGRYFVGSNSSVVVGDKTVMNRHSLFVATEGASISIGEGCLLSDVSMSTTDWHSIIDADTGDRINPAKDIVIERSVWLGESVTIQKGTIVGENSVIGAKAVVTKSVPPGSLAVGIPARIIKSNIRWQRELMPMPHHPATPYNK